MATKAMLRVLRTFMENSAAEILGERTFPFPHRYRVKHENPLLDFDVEEATVAKLVALNYLKASIEGIGDRLHYTITDAGVEEYRKAPPLKKRRGAR